MEHLSLAIELHGNLSDDEIIHVITDVTLRFVALFHLRGGDGFRFASVDEDGELGVEITHNIKFGTRYNTNVLLRLVPIKSEDISRVFSDFRQELLTDGFTFEEVEPGDD